MRFPASFFLKGNPLNEIF